MQVEKGLQGANLMLFAGGARTGGVKCRAAARIVVGDRALQAR